MKTTYRFPLSAIPPLLVAMFSFLLSPLVFSQGPLTPPGPPGPTMKTLEQIEPRKEINAANTPGDSGNAFIISQPGSYYLTGNLSGLGPKNAISIRADDVTLDLNGFALLGAQVFSIRGIIVPAAQRNLRILNGTVRNWPVCIDAENATDSVFENLRIALSGGAGLSTGANAAVKDCVSQGNTGLGIRTGPGSIVEKCVARGNGNFGILLGGNSVLKKSVADGNAGVGMSIGRGSTVSDCTATSNQTAGLIVSVNSIVSGCTATDNGTAGIGANEGCTISQCTATGNETGISTSGGATLVGCTASRNTSYGIFHGGNGTVSGCTVAWNGAHGIASGSNNQILANNCSNNGLGDGDGAGIFVSSLSSGNRIEGNSVQDNDRGIEVDSAGNLIAKNSARNNSGGNYMIVANNAVGETLNFSAGGTISETTAAWANLEF
jgi:parallel beta-helix repeat protein